MANPDSCRHDVIKCKYSGRYIKDENNPAIICISCGTRITKEIWLSKNYQYEILYDCYEHKPGVGRQHQYPGVEPKQRKEVEYLVYHNGRVSFGIDKDGKVVEPSEWDIHVISALAVANGG